MKGSFFSKPLEWSIETSKEAWEQGSTIQGTIKINNTSSQVFEFGPGGVGLCYAEIKKVHSRIENIFKLEKSFFLPTTTINPNEKIEFPFSIQLESNCPVTDKKSSYFITYGKDCLENHLQLNIGPKNLYQKIIGLLDTFQRFKVKEYKSSKKGVEYKLLPPASRDLANLESLLLTFSMKQEDLILEFQFQVKKLDTSSVTTKINKETLKVERSLTSKEYSLGKDLINQDQLIKMIEGVMSEVKLNNIF
ncbi:MAG: hypothetical protein AB7I27_10950 [Bacteriovoracaceae bacterium]